MHISQVMQFVVYERNIGLLIIELSSICGTTLDELFVSDEHWCSVRDCVSTVLLIAKINQ